jgi:hypothetical protein
MEQKKLIESQALLATTSFVLVLAMILLMDLVAMM